MTGTGESRESSTAAESPRCPSCQVTLSAAAIAAAAEGYFPYLRACQWRCPSCQEKSHVRFVPGRLWIGSTYAAGAMHFAPDAEYHAGEITGVWEAGGALHVRLRQEDGEDHEVIIAG